LLATIAASNLLASFAASLYAVNSAKAAVLYDNLSVASIGNDDQIATPPGGPPPGGFGPLYDSFSTSGSAFDVTQVQILVGLPGQTAVPGASFQVALYNNGTGNTPGSLNQVIGTVLDSALSTSFTVVSFNSLSITLAADTRYWIGLSSPNTAGLWSVATDDSGTGVAGEFFSNAGGTSPNVGQPYQMQVSGDTVTTATPLPAALPLFATGLGLLGLIFGGSRWAIRTV
jgi:hypothetical protein